MKKTLAEILAILTLAATACQGDKIDTDGSVPRLMAIIPAMESVEISDGEVELAFTVKDNGFDLLSRPVNLVKTDGETSSNVLMSGLYKVSGSPGRYMLHLTDTGLEEDFLEQLQLSVSLEGGSTIVSSPFSVAKNLAADAPDYMRTGLPVAFVNTEDGKGIYSKTDYVTAELRIRGSGGYESLQSVPCSIRGRGNTTWTWPKKPYLIKLDEKQHIFGMHKHKRWVLLANFMDRTLMRNMVAMKISSMTRLDWTPGCVPVELVLNGVHLGTYLLIEQVRVDNHRVDISEMTDQDNSGENLTGGYLLELDFHYDNEFQWRDHDIPFAVKYPDPEEITDAQKNYIKNYIAEVSAAIYGSGFKDPEKGYAKYLDVDSFIDYWIVYEVLCNHELGNPGSVFLHKDRGGKLTAGPCWDFDWGVLSFYTTPGDRQLINRYAIWYARLFQDEAFKTALKARFWELLPQLERIPDYMDECEAMLTKSANINFAMWNPADDRSQNGGRIINGDEDLSFHDAVTRLKSNYKTHLEIIKAQL